MSYKYIHKDFILTPIENVIKGAIYATHSISNGVESYPLNAYIMQSLFLRMTGFQEQKLKCLSWELASNDFDYRVSYSKERGYSTYVDKRNLYKELIDLILGIKSDYSSMNKTALEAIFDNSCKDVIELFSGEVIHTWNKRSFDTFKNIVSVRKADGVINNNSNNLKIKLTDQNEPFKGIYEKYLYRERNRIAHNTLSYQENLPTFNSLKDMKNQFNNYFLFFTMLTIIDRVFIKLYKDYLDLLKSG